LRKITAFLFWRGSLLIGILAIAAGMWEFALSGYWRLIAAGCLLLICLAWTKRQRGQADAL
jgi:hypothetical protein